MRERLLGGRQARKESQISNGCGKSKANLGHKCPFLVRFAHKRKDLRGRDWPFEAQGKQAVARCAVFNSQTLRSGLNCVAPTALVSRVGEAHGAKQMRTGSQ